VKLLFTYKPVDYMRTLGSYAGLVRFDLDRGAYDRILRIPAPAYRSRPAFSVPFAQGLAVAGKTAYVGMWNTVVLVDLDSFEIIDAFSSPQMADVHSIAVSDEHIFVVSTATECLLCFDRANHQLCWRWGPDAQILGRGSRGILPGFRSRSYRMAIRRLGLGSLLGVPAYRDAETRHVHKSRSPYYRHHLNNVYIHESKLYLNTKGWFDSKSSSVIELDSESLEARFLVAPGGFIGSHDGLVYRDWFYVTEADNNSIARVSLATLVIERFPVQPDGYFVRGLAVVDDTFIIGFTPRRETGDPPCIGQYDAGDLQRIRLVEVPDLYGAGDPLAIHTLALSPPARDSGR